MLAGAVAQTPSDEPIGEKQRLESSPGRRALSFMWSNKAFWIVPLVLILALLAIVLFTSEATTPFVYSLW